jgi:TPR repeat protein
VLFLLAIPLFGGAALVGAWYALKAGELKAAGGILLLGLCLIALTLFIVISAINHLGHALRERPSDLELDSSDLRIIGGPWHDRSFPIARTPCEVRVVEKTRTRYFSADKKFQLHQLLLNHIPVASAVRPVEQDSLHALHATITARQSPPATASDPKPPARKKALHTGLLVCPSCGAPAVPDDAASTTCHYCSTAVPIPQELAARIRAQRELAAARPANARAVARLLDQPSARVTSRVMLLLGIPISLVWPGVGIAAGLLRHRELLGFVNCAILVAGGALAIVALFFLMRAALIDRQALALISTGFTARPPERPGDPHGCRNCSAPLPPTDAVLVRCAYCDADNVLGLDVRHESRRAVDEGRSLEAELRRRRRERRVWTLAAAGSLAFLVASRWIVAAAFHPHGDTQLCHAGDPAACLRLGHKLEAKDTDQDDGDDHVLAARDAFATACDHGNAEGCREAARVMYTWKRWRGDAETIPALEKGCTAGDGRACDVAAMRLGEDPADFPRRLALYKRGCDQGDLTACNDEAVMLVDGQGTAPDKPAGIALYRKACDGGVGLACSNLGWQAEHADAPDLTEAARLYDLACAKDPATCPAGARFYARRCQAADADRCRHGADAWMKLKGEIGDDERELYERGCEQGVTSACYGAGLAVQKDDRKKARAYFTKACDGGSAEGCNSLGVTFAKSQDWKTARDAYEKGCQLGLAVACDNLAAAKGHLGGK